MIIYFETVFYAPYFPHVLDAWSKRTHPNLLFLFYEDRKKVQGLQARIVSLGWIP